MGTRFRTMLAPINASTGDGRRFGTGAITMAETPFPFEWARSREGGHDGAVVIGAVQEVATLTTGQAIEQGYLSAERAEGMDLSALGVWAKGELFDGIDRERMPRLAEDTAEALHLIEAGTLGPSVDLDTFEGVPVAAGTDDVMTAEAFERHFEATGEEPRLELLITAGRVRAATLVSIPAFAETSRPLELLPAEEGAEIDVQAEHALVASVGAAPVLDIAAFDRPLLAGPTPITYDFERGIVFGHIATWRTCHSGYPDVCVTAPKDATGEYATFNRFPVETDGGVVWAGRLTVGGRHAGLALSAGAAMGEYDGKTVAAHVRAYSDEFGIVVAGVIEPGLTDADRQVLARRKVSGDWRETSAGLSLVEVLALSPGPRAHSEPGFPVETYSRAGRQVALVASLGPEPSVYQVGQAVVDIEALADAIEARRVRTEAVLGARNALSSTLKTETDSHRAALAAALNRGGQ
jgi:hypothetical protein